MARKDETKFTVLLKAIHEYKLIGHYFNELDTQGKSDFTKKCAQNILLEYFVFAEIEMMCL